MIYYELVRSEIVHDGITHDTSNASRILHDVDRHAIFEPYPHRRVFNGFLEYGTYIAGDWERMKPRLYGMEKKKDSIQWRAMREGVFFPNREKFPKFHIFSSAETLQCIESKSIYFFGDSYTRQMFVGFADIILNKPSNVEIMNGSMRIDVVRETSTTLNKHLHKKTKVRVLIEHCNHGDLQCLIDDFQKNQWLASADVLVGNVLIHHLNKHYRNSNVAEHYLSQLQQLFEIASENLKLTWLTGPSYAINLIPELHRNQTAQKPTIFLNFETFKLAKQFGIPIIDMFSLTHSCKWRNCSYDGGHRSRFVNRMKAQMLLNNICKLERK